MGYSPWNLKKDGNDLVAKQEQQYTKCKINCCHYISFFLKVLFTQLSVIEKLLFLVTAQNITELKFQGRKKTDIKCIVYQEGMKVSYPYILSRIGLNF